MFRLSSGFLATVMAFAIVSMASIMPAEAKKKRSAGGLSLLTGSWKGYGTIKGERFRCDVRYSGKSSRATCRSPSGKMSSRSRLRSAGSGRYVGSWRSKQYTGSITVSRIRRNSHLLTIFASGVGTETMRMRRR